MFRLDAELRVYLHRDAVDFRNGINGLVILVEQSMQLDPFARAVFAFRNKRANRIKLLLYERSGFWLMMNYLVSYYNSFSWMRRFGFLCRVHQLRGQ